MDLLNQLKGDLNPEDGIAIAKENETITAPLRRYIKVIDEQANNIGATLLTRCTTLQLAEIISRTQAKGYWFYSAKTGEIALRLEGIRFNSVSNQIWQLSFMNSKEAKEEYYLFSDLGLDDKLTLIDIIENVLLNS